MIANAGIWKLCQREAKSLEFIMERILGMVDEATKQT